MLKKIMAGALMALVLQGSAAMAEFIEHPAYAKITTFTESVVASIKKHQDDFYVINKRYFQGLWLLGDRQVDGTTDETVINTSMPSDFNTSWKDFAPTVFKNNLKIPINIRIDVYQAPSGWGWIFRAEVYYPDLGPDAYGNYGDYWKYQHNEGPESFMGIWDEWFCQEYGSITE